MKQRQIRHLIFVFMTVFSVCAEAKIETVLGLPLARNANLPGSLPSAASSEILISRNQYVISYNKDRRAPNWVAWKVEAKNIGTSGRANSFSQDSELEQYLAQTDPNSHAVVPNEYTDSCMDRGHQVPSADRSDTAANNKQTFLMSNMIPQTPYLNRVAWVHLEEYTRDLVQQQKKKVYVIAGPIYDEDFGAIGPNRDIPVPSKDFKIIVILDAKQTWKDIGPKTEIISVVLPNVDSDGSKPFLGSGRDTCRPPADAKVDPHDWQQHQVPLQEIERLSGLQIFSRLPESL